MLVGYSCVMFGTLTRAKYLVLTKGQGWASNGLKNAVCKLGCRVVGSGEGIWRQVFGKGLGGY